MKSEEIVRRLRSIELCLTAHPDCEKGSEFEDRVFDLQEIQKSIKVEHSSTQLKEKKKTIDIEIGKTMSELSEIADKEEER